VSLRRRKHPRERRAKHGDRLLIVGLTGGIAMGKTTVARQFTRLGAALCDSDAIVHRLLGPSGAAVERVARLFPEARQDDHIDRNTLARMIVSRPETLQALEAILHPLVRQAQAQAIRQARRRGKRVMLLDIPLLFETGAQVRCDQVILVTAPPFLQSARALARPGMTEARLARILTRQWPDRRKREQADMVIHTGLGKAQSQRQARGLMARWMKARKIK
jgi:dephospho-CoA kinase